MYHLAYGPSALARDGSGGNEMLASLAKASVLIPEAERFKAEQNLFRPPIVSVYKKKKKKTVQSHSHSQHLPWMD